MPVTETVLVTDGTQRAALALTRAYGKAGHQVVVAAERVPSLAGVSRYARWQGLVPDALAAPGEFVARLCQIITEQRATVLVPVTEPALLAILAAPEAFAGCRVLAPTMERFLEVSDKARLLEAASTLGIAVPGQTVVPDIDAAPEAITAITAVPLVLKPARSVSGAGSERVKLGVRHARNRAELALELSALPAAAFPVLLQQRIVGPGRGRPSPASSTAA
jgi:predicted ATP-grasp superfamily ATP-dependent carboligase